MPPGAGPEELPWVLWVEDDPRLRRSFERIARRLPIRFVTDASAEEALARIAREGPPALLISDHELPGMNGLTLLTQVLRDHPAVTVVLSSGTAQAPAPGSGIGTLPKPVAVEAFTQLVGSVLPDPS